VIPAAIATSNVFAFGIMAANATGQKTSRFDVMPFILEGNGRRVGFYGLPVFNSLGLAL
jgi:hypothetical protein